MEFFKLNNEATFRMAPGYKEFEACEATAGFGEKYEDDPLLSNETHIIEDDDEIYCKLINYWKEEARKDQFQVIYIYLDKSAPPAHKYGKISVLEVEDKESGESNEILLLIIRQRVRHMIPSPHLLDMARTVVIPRRLRKCKILLCSSCLYSKATKSYKGIKTLKNTVLW